MSKETKIIPTLGRIVLYKLDALNADAINRRRTDAIVNQSRMQQDRIGYQAHVGNQVDAGQVIPGMVVGINTEQNINIKLMLDGNDNHWITSANNGEDFGQWDWMDYQKDQAKKTKEN